MPGQTDEKRPIDPGPARRKSNSCCRFLLAICACITMVVTGLLLFLLFKALLGLVSFSHASSYHYTDAKTSPLNYSEIVTPLIDDGQYFDIVATVWTTKSDKEFKEQLVLKRKQKAASTIHGTEFEENYENVLYSGIVFKRLRLKDKHVMVDVPLRIPMAQFRQTFSYPYDLRASFILVPASPSPLDFLESYSSWTRLLAGRMPPASPSTDLITNNTAYTVMQAKALESFAVHVPLLKMLKVTSKCQAQAHSDSKNEHYESTGPTGLERPIQPNNQMHRWHPHIVTRTQIRIAEETHDFNRTAYDRAHATLSEAGCRSSGNTPLGRYFNHCDRSYEKNGHWETRLVLSVPVTYGDGTTFNETRYAYSPYLGHLDVTDGSKDVVRVADPESCPEDASSGSALVNEEDYMDVTWHVSFTGRTPSKLAVGDRIFQAHLVPYPDNATEYEVAANHRLDEAFNGLFGHRFSPDAHPRRELGITVTRDFLQLLSGIIEVHYWYTCSSTYSLSIVGTLMLVFSRVVELAQEPPSNWIAWLLLPMLLLKTSLMVKAALRLAFGWYGWIPVMRRAVPTHLERASARVEARTPWCLTVLLLGISMALCYLFDPSKSFIVKPIGPQRPSTSNSGFISFPLDIGGLVLQLSLNHRMGFYAGFHKINGLVIATRLALHHVSYIPAVVGPSEWYGGISVGEVVSTMVLGWALWQIFTLPNRLDDVEDESVD